MQSRALITTIGPWALFVGTAFAALLAFESGLRLGRWRSRQPDPEPLLPARMIISSVLGLSAFVLAFAFGIAASHFDARNQALDDEAVAIGTAYHRADLLPEPERTKLHGLLRQYVDLRLSVSQSSDTDKAILQLRLLQERIWSQAIAAPNATTGQSPHTIVIQSLNDVIDVKAERVLRNMKSQIPFGVWKLLIGISLISFAAAGYHSGLAGARRRSFAALAYALVFAGVIVMIADADLPGFGQFQANKQALIDLQGRFGTTGQEDR